MYICCIRLKYGCTSTWVHVLISTVAHSKGALTLLDEFVSPVFGPEKWILWVYPRHKHGNTLKIQINSCLDPTKNEKKKEYELLLASGWDRFKLYSGFAPDKK